MSLVVFEVFSADIRLLLDADVDEDDILIFVVGAENVVLGDLKEG